MKPFVVTIEWTLACHQEKQTNSFPIYASSEVNAINIARTHVHKFAKTLGQFAQINSETVKEKAR